MARRISVKRSAMLFIMYETSLIVTTTKGSHMGITELLSFAVEHKSSDLHLSADSPPMIRVDGDIRKINIPALSHQQVQELLGEIMNDAQRNAYEQQLEADFSFEVNDLARFRINVFVQNRGAAAVIRIIPTQVLTLTQLNAPETFTTIADNPRGLVLVTGATGSGKSTTLAAMIDYINATKYQHIVTIEDPIEFIHHNQRSLVSQREVRRDTHSFSNALRSALREDPDVILVGEMRDLETIRLALTAAETGHLVFATLHTCSAAQTIDRIVEVFPGAEQSMVRSMLSQSLRAVISQTLVKKIGGGRIAAHEIMIATAAIKHLIREDKVAQMYSSIQTGMAHGMQTLDQCLQQLLKQGAISKIDAYSQAAHPASFAH